jgi:hypothetical protein
LLEFCSQICVFISDLAVFLLPATRLIAWIAN